MIGSGNAGKPVAKPAKAGKAPAATTKAAKPAKAPTASEKAGNGGAKAPTGAKAKIFDMIARKNGASAAEVYKELGWVKAGATIGLRDQARELQGSQGTRRGRRAPRLPGAG